MAAAKQSPSRAGGATGAKGNAYDGQALPTLIGYRAQTLAARYGLGFEAAAMVAALAFGGAHG